MKKKEYVELGSMEKEARGIVYEIRERSFEGDWGYAERVLANAFKADLYSERTREKWVALADVLENDNLGKPENEARVKKAFNRMVRAGYLYSRIAHGGKRYYGLHYK